MLCPTEAQDTVWSQEACLQLVDPKDVVVTDSQHWRRPLGGILQTSSHCSRSEHTYTVMWQAHWHQLPLPIETSAPLFTAASEAFNCPCGCTFGTSSSNAPAAAERSATADGSSSPAGGGAAGDGCTPSPDMLPMAFCGKMFQGVRLGTGKPRCSPIALPLDMLQWLHLAQKRLVP